MVEAHTQTLALNRELCNINKLKFDVIKCTLPHTRKWMKIGWKSEGFGRFQAKRKWIALFGLNRFNKLPLFSRCNSCVYSIRWPFSSRELVKREQHSTAPIKLVVVQSHPPGLHCTMHKLQSYRQLVSIGCVLSFQHPHRNSQPPLCAVQCFAIIAITIAHVQLPPLCKLPFVWLFHLYSVVFLSSKRTLRSPDAHKIANLCSCACVLACVRRCALFLGKNKSNHKNISITNWNCPTNSLVKLNKTFPFSYSIFYVLL